jgi:hypothetical protein
MTARMTDWIGELARTVSFPVTSRVACDWPAIESSLGVDLPASYRDYVEYFPSGRINGALFVFHPGSDGGLASLIDHVLSTAGGLDSLRDVSAEIPYEFYPAKGGLIPWGAWETMLLFTWLPIGHPDSWPIVMLNDDLEFQVLTMTVPEFLTRLIRRDGDWSIVLDEFWEQDFEFHPGPMP